MRELLSGRKRASAVDAAAQVDFVLAPIGAGIFACFAIREHGALRGDDDAGDSIEREAVRLFLEEVLLVEEGSRCRPDGAEQPGEASSATWQPGLRKPKQNSMRSRCRRFQSALEFRPASLHSPRGGFAPIRRSGAVR